MISAALMEQMQPQSSESLATATPARIAIVSTPRTGNTWVRHLLAKLYGASYLAVHSPGELDWATLPRGLVLQMHWPPTPAFVALLERHGFQTVTLARHPLDTLISILHFAMHDDSTACWLQGDQGNEDGIFAAMPCSSAFLDYATGPRAAALLAISRAWWSQPGCQRLRYEAMIQDPCRALGELVHAFAMPTHCSVAEAVAANTFSKLREHTRADHHFWRGQLEQWKMLLPATEAQGIARAQEGCFATLGYGCDPNSMLTVQQADATWIRLTREELADRMRRLKAAELSIHSLRGELGDVRTELEGERRLRLKAATELAAERRRLLDALSALDIERRELQETRAVLESARGRLARLETLRRLSARFPKLSAAVKKMIRYDDANHDPS
jgi:hypothetical protein